MAKKKITDIVAEELELLLKENELELYNVEFVKEVKDWFLRVYIDRIESAQGEGIGTDDCEMVSRYLSLRLDELNPIEQNYYLEVSSPGMDRALLKEADYTRYAGQLVDITLYKAIDGRKSISGELEGLTDGNIVIIDEKNDRIEIPMEKAAKTKLAVVF